MSNDEWFLERFVLGYVIIYNKVMFITTFSKICNV